MKNFIYSVYALFVYLIFLFTFLYFIGFVENLVVTKQISYPIKTDLLPAIFINLGLLLLFGLQHSIMARKSFKKQWTKLLPKPVERSTYVLFSSIAIFLIIWFWEPINYTLWDVRGTVFGNILYCISFIGFVIVVLSSFLINHTELLGLQQILEFVRNQPSQKVFLKQSGFYKYVRHPMYLGFVIAFWFTPFMTAGHLLFSLGMTIYILIGIYFEERDHIIYFGDSYRKYKKTTAKLIPFIK